MLDNLEALGEEIKSRLEAKDIAREQAIKLSREVIRYSGQSIKALHRREFENSRMKIELAKEKLDELKTYLNPYPDLKFNLSRDAEKEFAEAKITFSILVEGNLRSPEELGVEDANYLNALGESIGEMRRYLLDNMRKGDLSQGEDLLSTMDDIYNVLILMDFPESITGGLRRTLDLSRGIIEKSRSDLTLAIKQKELEDKLNKLERS